MKLAYTILPLLMGATLTIAEVRAANPSVGQIAQEITVRIDGVSSGSGVIIDRKGDTYYILTNAHVFKQKDGYGVITPDGKRYPCERDSIKIIPGMDLALVSFKSNLTYRVAILANSDKISPGQKVYVSGWSKSGGSLREQVWVNTEGILTETNSKLPNGYSITYSNLVRAGMSGGPVLDEQGRVIAINGIVRLENNNSNNIVASGIAINKFISWLKGQNLSLASPTVNQSQPAINTRANNFAILHKLVREKNPINSIAIDNNNSLSISGDSKGNIAIWNLKTGELIRTWKGHNSGIKTILITPDGQNIITGGEDGNIKIWQSNTGTLIKQFNSYQGEIYSLVLTADGKTLISGGADQNIKIINFSTGEVIQNLAGHSGSITSLSLSGNQQILASGSLDSTIRIWNLKTGQLIRTLKSNDLSVLSLAISPDGKILVNGGTRGIMDIWDIATGKLIQSFKGHSDGIWTVTISPDSKTIISGSWDRNIKLWDIKTAKLIDTLNGHSAYISAIALSHNGQYLVSSDWNGQIIVWQTKSRPHPSLQTSFITDYPNLI